MADRIDALTGRVEAVEVKLDALAGTVDALSASVDERFDEVDRRFDEVDRRFDEVDRRFDEVTAALVEQRQYTELAYTKLDSKMDAGFARFERKLDQFIDAQIRTNEITGRRLRALESPAPDVAS